MREAMIRRVIIFIIPAIFLAAVSSCVKDKPVWEPPQEVDQTVFMYMPWSTNLTSYFHRNIEDFETIIGKGILRDERVLVFMATSSTAATLFELRYSGGKAVRKEHKTYKNHSYTTAEGITAILEDVKSLSPSRRYAMIVSAHGMGWLPVSSGASRSMANRLHWDHEGVPLTRHDYNGYRLTLRDYLGSPLTRFFGGLTAEYQTEVTTLVRGIADAGLKMEYIMFDDCYMSTVEVAYELRGVAGHLIACPTEIMAHGFPYDIVGEYLVGTVDYEGVCDGFYEFYNAYIDPYGTIGVTDCSELDALAAIMKDINGKFAIDASQLASVQRMDGYSPVIFFDMGDYVSKLCTDAYLLGAFETQLERTVPLALRRHTDSYYSMKMGPMPINVYSGITISDPSLNPMASAKTETAWYKATH